MRIDIKHVDLPVWRTRSDREAAAALCEWNYPRQMLAIRQSVEECVNIYGDQSLLARAFPEALSDPSGTLPLNNFTYLLPVHDRGTKFTNFQVVGRLGMACPGPVVQTPPARNCFPA